MIGRSQGLLAATVWLLGAGACDAPVQSSDLRPGGPPEVLTVLVANDTDGTAERATFCKPRDDKRPGLVPANPHLDFEDPNNPAQVCPDNLADEVPMATDVVPVDWYVRVQFDELLDPDIEALGPIDGSDQETGSLADSDPVVLSCNGVEIPYVGFYIPSGNSLSWPVGPSLQISPADSSTIATGSQCQITLKSDVVVDKSGERVPEDQAGPYIFQIAPLALASTDPEVLEDPTMPTTIVPRAPVVIRFNATVAPTSLTPNEVSITELPSDASCEADPATGDTRMSVVVPDPMNKQAFNISDSDPDVATGEAWLHDRTYIVTFTADAEVQDTGGATGLVSDSDPLVLCFKTDK